MVAEQHRVGITTVLAADAELDIFPRLAAALDGDLHQLTDAGGVDRRERIRLEDAFLGVLLQERPHVVSAHAEAGLGEVVGAERKELGRLRDLVGREGAARDLDHRAHEILDLLSRLLLHQLGDPVHDLHLVVELLLEADERDHDLGLHLDAGLLHLGRGLEDGAGLHLRDLGIADAEAAAAVAEHRVELVQGVHAGLHRLDGQFQLLGQVGLGLLVVRHEFMEWRIEKADRGRSAVEGLEDAFEVVPLVGEQLGERLAAVVLVLGENHLPHRVDAVALEEHVLGPRQADALGAEGDRVTNLLRRVGIRPYAKLPVLVSELHDEVVILEDLRVGRLHRPRDQHLLELAVGGLDGTGEDLARRAIDRDRIAFLELLTGTGECALRVVDLDRTGTGDADLAHLPGHERRMARHATAAGEDALGGDHAAKILGARLDAGEHHLDALVGQFLGLGGREHELPGGGAGTGRQARGQKPGALLGGGVVGPVEDRRQELRQRVGVGRLDRMLGRHELLLHHVVGDLHVGQCRPFAVPRLQHVELLLLDRELEVLHVAELLFERLADLLQLLVGAGKHRFVLHLGHGLGRPHAGDDVFALGVDQILAVEGVFAGGRVTGEGHASRAVVAHVAEHHALHVDGGAPLVGDLVLAAVENRPLVHPAAEDGANGAHELLERILREALASPLLDERQIPLDQLAEMLFGEVGVVVDAELMLEPLHRLLEGIVLVFVPLLHPHHHVAVHLDEAAVGVVGEPGIAGGGSEPLHGVVVQTQIQDRVHHARHAVTGTGTNAHKQGVFGVAELLAGLLLHELHGGGDIVLEALRELLAVLVVIDADLRRDREARGHRQADLGHLGEIGPLAAEQGLHRAVAVAFFRAEVIDHLARLAALLPAFGGR